MTISLRFQHAWSTVLNLSRLSTPLPYFQGFLSEIHVRPVRPPRRQPGVFRWLIARKCVVTQLVGLVTLLTMSTALFLGFNATTGQYLPLHADKLLHFVAFAAMSFGSCWTFHIPNGPYERVWYREHFSLVLSSAGWSVASVMSEVLQGLLPSKTFQYGDILANLAGTLVGLYAAYQIQARVRQHLELSPPYRPLEADNTDT